MNEAKNHEDVLIIDRQHTSWYVAGLLLLLLITFVVGFIWGRRASMLEEQQKIADEAFVDKAHYALLVPDTSKVSVAELPEADEAVAHQRYQAQLIGFGQLTRAQAFVNKLKQRGVVTKIETRKSRNGNKRTVWYQVVTEPYADLAELELFAQRLKATERLKSIKIVTMDKSAPSV